MKFEEMWFILTLLREIREPSPLFGKAFHALINEKQFLQKLGWVEENPRDG